MKTCTRCKEQKPLSEFGVDAGTMDEKVAACKACVISSYTYGSPTWARIMLNNTRLRAARKKVPFELIAVRELLASPPKTCPILGLVLQAGGKGHQGPGESSATIDRRIPMKGYVAGNMDILSRRANYIKQDATTAEVRAVADWLEFYEDLIG